MKNLLTNYQKRDLESLIHPYTNPISLLIFSLFNVIFTGYPDPSLLYAELGPGGRQGELSLHIGKAMANGWLVLRYFDSH